MVLQEIGNREVNKDLTQGMSVSTFMQFDINKQLVCPRTMQKAPE